MEVDKKLSIVLIRDPATEFAARILKDTQEKLCPVFYCFVCGRRSTRKGFQGLDDEIDVVETFANSVEEFLGRDVHDNVDFKGDSCPNCFEIMENVWTLQKQIGTIREEIKTIVEKACGSNSRPGRKRRRCSSPRRPLEDLCIIVKDEDTEEFENYLDDGFAITPGDNEGQENVDSYEAVGMPEAEGQIPVSSPRKCDRLILQASDNNDDGQGQDGARQSQESFIAPSSSPRPRPIRKSRVNAEIFLKETQEVDGEELIEANDDIDVNSDGGDFQGSDSEDSDEFNFTQRNKSRSWAPKRKDITQLAMDSWRCDICQKTFKIYKYARQHIENVHEKTVRFSCSLCEKGFHDRTKLNLHMQSNHGATNAVSEKRLNLLSSLNIVNEGGKWKCLNDNCGIYLKSARTAKRHVESIHLRKRNHVCEICGKDYYFNSLLQQHKRDKHEEVRPPENRCRACGKTFYRKRFRVIHEATVCKVEVSQEELANHKINVIPCEFAGCTRLLSTRKEMEEHMKIHGEERSYKCSYCDKTYKTRTTVRTHERLIHIEPLKRFQCDHCEASFKTKAGLKDHVLVAHQIGTKDKVCDLCGLAFHTSGALRNHQHRNHDSSLVPCDKCNKKMSPYALTKHRKRNTCVVNLK